MATVEAVMKLVTVLGILIYSSGAVLAQSTLRIVSPKEDAVFNPGQTVTVIVEATGGPFEEVFIVAGDPIGGSEEELATPPYKFTVNIPREIASDSYILTAEGYTPSRGKVKKETISIIVERAESPVSLSVGPTSSLVLYPGHGIDLFVTGVFPDGSKATLQKSTLT